MSMFQDAAAAEYVMLVDRAGTGGCTITFDGHYITFKPGQKVRPVPQFLAAWILSVDQHKVHTTDGDFVCRFGVETDGAPEEFFQRIGGPVDCSPIQIDKTRVEGWNTAYADRPGETRTIQLKRNPADYASDAAPGGGAFGNQR